MGLMLNRLSKHGNSQTGLLAFTQDVIHEYKDAAGPTVEAFDVLVASYLMSKNAIPEELVG